MTIHTAIERITPAQAERYLEHNTTNRSLRPKHVDRLVSDIVSGRWHMNGSSIVFNGDGTLLDGQHRLAAVVKSGVPVDVVVVRGISKAAMQTIDSNISRSARDVASMRGYINAAQLISTARTLVNIKSGARTEGERFSTGAVMEFLQKHPHLQDSVSATKKFQKTLPLISIAAWHYLAFYIGGFREETTAAMNVLETGIPHFVDDPIHVFRERALRDRHLMQGSATRRLDGFWTTVMAWNDFKARTPRKICRIQQAEVLMDGVDYSKI